MEKRPEAVIDAQPLGKQIGLSQVHKHSGGGLSALQEISAGHLLVDHSENIISRFTTTLNEVVLVLDNAGMELFSDLLLADYLLSQGLAQKVHIHAKACPTFVSDATLQDINFLLGFLGNLPHAAPLRAACKVTCNADSCSLKHTISGMPRCIFMICRKI